MLDYVPGKAAWLAAGLPSEGSLADGQRVGALAGELPVAVVDRAATVADARAAAEAAGAALVVVVMRAGGAGGASAVVDAAVPVTALEGVEADASVASVAAPDPVTVRPSLPVRDLVDRLRDDETPFVVVTRPDGTLVGAVARGDLLARARRDELP